MKAFGIVTIFFALIIESCSPHPPKIQTGLVDSIHCKLAPEQVYAAYIPDSCELPEALPAFFLFDPSARARLAVEQYKQLAQKYKVAFFCSYNSKNGPIENNQKAADAMIADVKEKYPINGSAIYLSGFSGGSRFSYVYASTHPDIKGVIACGAFYPGNSNNNKLPSFTYSGIAGTFDFNFPEGLSMRNQLLGQNFPFQFITFDGKHGWPPIGCFERALTYQLSKNQEYQALSMRCTNLEQEALKTSIDSGNFINAVWIYQNLMMIDPGSGAMYNDSLKVLVNNKIFKKQSKDFSRNFKLEDSLNTEFSNAIRGIIMLTYNQPQTHKPLNWWKQKLKMLDRMSENSKDIFKRNSAERIKGQIGVMAWETNRKLTKEKYYDQSLELAEILLLLEPESPTYLALKAENLALMGKTGEAKNFLGQAKEKGFTWKNEFLGSNAVLKNLENAK